MKRTGNNMDDCKEIIVKEYHNDKGLITRREIGQELIRCKYCKYYWKNLTEDDPDELYKECRWGNGETPNPDDYCSYGELKGTENDSK